MEANTLPGLSNEQWQVLLQTLKGMRSTTTEKMTGKKLSWIIDTGASNHMTGNLNFLHNIHEIPSCPVGLPDGSESVATLEGSVALGGDLLLRNALFVPNLTCNLISVSQLMENDSCFIQFTKNLCVIQDRTSRILIGAGEQRDGLYYFQEIPRIKAMRVTAGN